MKAAGTNTHIRYYALHRGENGIKEPGVWVRRTNRCIFIAQDDLVALADALVDISEAIDRGENPNQTVLKIYEKGNQ